MHRSPYQWSKLDPAAVLAGSEAQRLNVMTMMRDDLVLMGQRMEAIKNAAEVANVEDCYDLAERSIAGLK